MLEKLVKDWKGELQINDNYYANVQEASEALKTILDGSHIILRSTTKCTNVGVLDGVETKIQYRVTVKKYMTEKASPGFDFMAKWNNDNPMPLRVMIGIIERETRGMVYMKLHGVGEPTIRCMRCGRLLTNPVSKMYGIGPECMSKVGLTCAITDINTIKSELTELTWKGWIIKSAIIEREEI